MLTRKVSLWQWVYSIKITGTPWGRSRWYRETDNVFTGTHWNDSEAVLWTHADRLDPPFLSGDADGTALPPRGRGPTCPDSSSNNVNASVCQAELYNLDASPVESLMVGLFSIFQGMGNLDRSNQYTHDEYNSIHLGFSRDGFHWFRPSGPQQNVTICDHCSAPSNYSARLPFMSFDRSTLGKCSAAHPEACAWNSYNIQSVGGGLIVMGDEFRFYASADSGNNANGQQGNSSTGVAKLRRDGFAAVRCRDSEPQCSLLTRPLVAAGRPRLFVNADARAGSLRVAVLSADSGAVLPGYSEADSIALAGNDTTRAAMHWRNSPNLPRGPYRLRFALSGSTKLFSFWAAADACGASNGYVAAGGPGFDSTRDTQGSCASL